MNWLRFGRKVVSVTLALGSVSACQAIAGIEDRSLDPDADEPAVTPECQEYCTRVMTNCTDKFQVYSTVTTCHGICALLDPGDPLEPAGNTLACRSAQAKLAEREPTDHCPLAGPGGGGTCGSDCEAYCQLYAKACDSEYPTHGACLKACKGLTDQDRFDVTLDHEGDTLECRLVHVSSASVEPKAHCPHAPIVPSPPWCMGAADAAPSCEEYCNIELAACDGELAQYESKQQCLDTCAALDPGTNADRVENTVGCRRYHSFSATLAADMHCSHTGPGGEGHCGRSDAPESGRTGNCDSYCRIVASACPDDFAATYESDADCQAECVELDEAGPDSKYSVASAKQSSAFQCRLLHATRALEDAAECGAALGGDDCSP